MNCNKWPSVRLGDVCEINPRLEKDKRPADTERVTFVPMAAIAEESASIVGASVRPYSEVKNGFTSFRENDVLFAKITPCMENGKIAIAHDLENGLGFGSTEFHVVRASPRILPEMVRYYFLRPSFREQAKRRMTGAVGQQRVPSNYLSESTILLPPIEVQRRIVELLARSENLVRMRREAEAKAREIIPALFLDTFGDPSTNAKRWPIHPVSHIVRSAEYGTSMKANLDGSGVVMMRMGNVDVTGRLNLDELKYVKLTEKDRCKFRLDIGDILFNRTNSKDLVGKTGIWRGECDAVAASYFIRVRVNTERMEPDYFWAFMNSRHMKQVLFSTARGAIGQSNINAEELRGLPIPVPPIEIQKRFAAYVNQTLSLERQHSVATKHAVETFQSMMTGIFEQDVATRRIAQHK